MLLTLRKGGDIMIKETKGYTIMCGKKVCLDAGIEGYFSKKKNVLEELACCLEGKDVRVVKATLCVEVE
jgi:hypothetical protein